MSPIAKKRVNRKLKPFQHQPTRQEIEDEKENKSSKVECKQSKDGEDSNKVHIRGEFEKFFSPLSTPNTKLKPAGFWSKKLLDLEESDKKQKKCGPYEFNGTDESESSYRTRKGNPLRRKPKQKGGVQKKKQISKGKKLIELEKKPKEIHKQALGREVILTNESRKTDGKGQKFTFFTETKNLGITSTPSVNRDNLIVSPNFLFLSPIIREEVKINNVRVCSPVKAKDVDGYLPTTNFGQETPKVETKLKTISCRRVLRSGKMLIP